jgi:hypothetical protein
VNSDIASLLNLFSYDMPPKYVKGKDSHDTAESTVKSLFDFGFSRQHMDFEAGNCKKFCWFCDY